MKLLLGKTAIITGAGRGLGRAYAELLAQEGANVVVNDIAKEGSGSYLAEAVATSICTAGGNATFDTSDVSTVSGAQALFDKAIASYGSANILINNAGILRDASLLKLSDQSWDTVMSVNLRSAFTVTKPIFSWMKDNGGGVVVNTSSTSGLIGNFGQANYAASKGGMWAFSNVLTIEGRKHGIRVWTLAPGAVSELTKHLLDEKTAAELNPAHVAQVVLYMVSDLSNQRTGHLIYASGQRIMEMKLQAAHGISGSGRNSGVSARSLATMEEDLFCTFANLTLDDLSK